MRKILLLTYTVVVSVLAIAQTTGDYQSFTSGNWSDASTWLRYNGVSFVAASIAPSNSDGVISILSGHTVTVNSGVATDETVVNAGGTLVLTSGLTIANGAGDDITVNGAFTFNSGTLSGVGNMKVNGTMEWQSGSIQSANVQLAVGSVSSKTTAGLADVNNAVLTNNGNFSWTQGNFQLQSFGIFNNGVTGIITATGNDAMNPACCTVAFNNAGTFTKSAGTGTTSINVDGSNSGTINVNVGTISSAGVFANSGTIGVASGKTFLVNGGTFSLNTGSNSTGAGNFQFSSGAITVNAPAVTPATATNYLFSGGAMNGTGTLSVTGGMEWQTGSIQQANVVLASGSVSSKTTAGLADVNNAVLTNNGNFSWTQGNFQLQSFGIFNNGVTGIITATGNDAMNPACCTVAFNNAGTFTKSAGTGTTSINVDGSNSGTINVNVGTISSAEVFANSGTIGVASGKTFLVNGGTFSLNTGSNSTGAGNFQFSSGAITVNAPAVTPATATNYLFSGGAMNGTGTLSVTGGMEWQTGSIQQAKVVLAAGSVSFKTTTGLADVNNAVLTNNGNFTWVQGNIQLQNFSVFNNSVTGVIDATGNDVMSFGCCVVSFNNAGTFIKSNSSGNTSFTVDVSNSGTIKGIGTINFTSSFANSGIIAPGTSPGLLTINGVQPLSTNSTLQIEMQDGSGPGTGHDQLIRAGSMTLAGTITVTSTVNVPVGTYTIINLTSGTTSGSFATVNIPPGTSLQINPTNVQLIVNVVLPLNLISFTGSLQNNDALLQWKTANETGVSKFEVQRSDNGQTFITIGTVVAGGTSYSLTDANTFSSRTVAYYRLKSIDVDARFTYSNVLRLTKQTTTALIVYPNPVKDVVTISGLKEKGTILLFNADGKLLHQQIVSAQTMTMDMSKYAKGTYLLQYKAEDEVVNQKIIKQ